MNISSNPWSFLPADVVAGVPAANGLVLNADGTVTLTTVANLVNGAVGVNANDSVTVRNATSAYNGFYRVLIGAAGTVFTLLPQFAIPAGTAAGGGGQVAKCLYNAPVRVEDISWQRVVSQGDVLDFADRNGNPLWQASGPGPGWQNRGKVYWAQGLTPFELDSGIVLVTVD